MTSSVNIQTRHDAKVLSILKEIPGLDAVANPRGKGGILLRFVGSKVAVGIEFKRLINAANAWQIVNLASTRSGSPLLVVASDSTAEARRILVEHDISFADARGNVHIEQPGLLFHREGSGRIGDSAMPRLPARLSGKAGVVAQALLIEPQREWRIKDLAQLTGVAKGLVHRVVVRLEREGLVTSEGNGPHRIRRVSNATALLDLWSEEQSDRPRRLQGYVLAQSPSQLIKLLGKRLEATRLDYAISGAAAANLLAPFVTAIPVVEVWVSAWTSPDELFKAVGGESVSDGHNVVFLQGKDDSPLIFRERIQGLWLGNRFRVYLDLRRDPKRGKEQADHLRREVIKL